MNMKKTLYIFSLLVVLCGCTDFLGIKPRGYDVAERLEHYQGLLYGSEPFMLDESFPYMCFELFTTEDGYGQVYSNIGSNATNAFKWEADILRPDENCGEWNNPASMLYPLNIVIAEVLNAEDGTQEQKKAIHAEARAMRAWHTFFMSQFFGKPYTPQTAASDLCVPIITKAATIGNDFERKTVEQVYSFVTSEMEAALPDLPSDSDHCRRVFGPTANAMLGKFYWNMGLYSEALPFLEAAYKGHKTAGMGLLDYNTMIETDGTIKYPVDELKNPELMYTMLGMPCLWPSMMAGTYGTLMLGLKTEVLKKYYTPDDCRLCFISGMDSGKSAHLSFKDGDIYYINMSRITSEYGMCVPDLYMMYAECLARTENYVSARSVIEEFRRSRLPAASAAVPAEVADGDALVKFIVDERMREFIGYGNTWFDTRRLWNDPLFQDMKSMYTHTDGVQTWTLTEERLTMRIPPSVMEWHPEYTDNK